MLLLWLGFIFGFGFFSHSGIFLSEKTVDPFAADPAKVQKTAHYIFICNDLQRNAHDIPSPYGEQVFRLHVLVCLYLSGVCEYTRFAHGSSRPGFDRLSARKKGKGPLFVFKPTQTTSGRCLAE